MGNLALLLRASGHGVKGCDAHPYPPMSDYLRDAGIDVAEGYDPADLIKARPDLVIIGNAVGRGNPQVEWLLETENFPFTSMSAFLFEQVLAGRPRFVVAGTHGKTTTASCLAWLLRELGESPGYLIGGLPRQLPGGSALGRPGAPFVIEGDEYDTAFFDKRAKFIHYRPHYLLLNNLEFDHGDIYRDFPDIQRSFRHLTRLVPRTGAIIANGDDPGLAEVLEVTWTRLFRVGTGDDNDCRIADFKESPEGVTAHLHWKGDPHSYPVRLRLGGLFNLRNAAMTLAALRLRAADKGLPTDPAPWIALLESFRGVKRRQELLHQSDKVVLLEDFGHHPTAITATIASLRCRFPDSHLTVAFEPRSNTAATNRFQTEFAVALTGADAVYLAPVHRGESIPSNQRLDTAALATGITEAGRVAKAFTDFPSLEKHLTAQISATSNHKRVICFFSNGSFEGIQHRLAGILKENSGS
jgi:UDP-N-acetylmuramate: L-alanyl-gamma-D-glutamyl-meso-diaminopimelate ligase